MSVKSAIDRANVALAFLDASAAVLRDNERTVHDYAAAFATVMDSAAPAVNSGYRTQCDMFTCEVCADRVERSGSSGVFDEHAEVQLREAFRFDRVEAIVTMEGR